MSARLALVTGASAGIGAAFARLYARHGYDLALTARREGRLRELSDEIRLSHGVEVLIIPADLADPKAPDAILAEIAANGRDVDALVNNAGYGMPGAFAAAPWEEHARFIQVMVTAPCELAHKVLPGMQERRFGRIVNVASLAGLAPGGPGATLYGASKAFMVRFSQSLHQELAGAGVHVSALCPGFTYSEFHDANQTRAQINDTVPAWLWMGADEVAAAG
ncbi:MAG TPA: SDR family oxidoreductase, partial [Caulobacteraceae bacterium]